jgi:hypothetical protein
MKEMILNGLQQAHQNFEHMLADFLPRFIVMLVIILIGWLVAYIIKLAVRTILKFTEIDRVSEEAGASQLLRRADLPAVSELLCRALFWVIWLAFITVGISILGIVSLQQHISNLLTLLPQIFVAFFVLFVGYLAANFFSRTVLLAGVNAGLPAPRLLSETVRALVGLLALSMALEQIGLGRQTVLIAFSIAFGALMLGLAIAFGLGGRDLAKSALERIFTREKKGADDELSPL